MPNIKPAELQKEVLKYLTEYKENIDEEIEETTNKITKEAKEELKQVSREKFKLHGREKPYYSGWAVKNGRKSSNKYIKAIWNKTNYQLTHLLEFGHATRNGKRTEAIPHIRPTEEKYSEKFEKEIKNAIKRRSK